MTTSIVSSTQSLISFESDFAGLIDVGTDSLTLAPQDLFFTTTSLFALVQDIALERSEFIHDVVESLA